MYTPDLSESKIPWSLRRTRDLIKAFFTGIVPKIPEETIKQRKENWRKLELAAKQSELEWTRNRAKNRRASMKETAERANYMLVGLALVTAFGASLLVSNGTSATSRLLLLLGFTLITVSTIFLLIAICAKWQVMKRPRKTGDSEGDEHLANTVKIQEETQTSHQPNMELYYEYESYVTRLHKCKIRLLVERRAQCIFCWTAVAGLAIMLIGCWAR